MKLHKFHIGIALPIFLCFIFGITNAQIQVPQGTTTAPQDSVKRPPNMPPHGAPHGPMGRRGPMGRPQIAQNIDPNVKPTALPVKEFTFPKYTEKTLSNGLKVFVIEDHKQPTIMFRMEIQPGATGDKKPGTAQAMSDLLPKGAGKRSALDIAQTLDGIGANFSANAPGDLTTISASGIKKHLPLILEIFSDIIKSPMFSKEEFDKLMPQEIANLKQEKARAGSLAQAMARKVVYGEKHPYAMKATEESMKTVTLEDIKSYHDTYFKPNMASLAVVGDVTADEMIGQLEKAFADWKKGDAPKVTIPTPTPMPQGVYYVERPGSVQSAIVMSSLVVPMNHPDFEVAQLAGNVIGAGFAGRLFRTLREKYSFTYTPFGFVSNAKYANRFACGADVRSKVTDSTILITKRELKKLATEPPSEEELSLLKRYLVGEFLMSFEKTETAAYWLQLADFNGIPFETIKSRPARINAITPLQVQQAAAKYMDPDKMSIVIVGAKETEDVVAHYGELHRYNIDIEPVKEATMEKLTMTENEFWQKHIDALGGKSAVEKLTSLITTSELSLSAGPQKFKGKGINKKKSGGKVCDVQTFPVLVSKAWANGEKAWESGGGPVEEKTGKDFEGAIYDAQIIPSAMVQKLNWKTEILGKKDGIIQVKISSPQGNEKTISFDATTFFVSKVEYTQISPQGTSLITEKYSNYTKIDGVMLPLNTTVDFGQFVENAVNSYQSNVKIDEAEFMPSADKPAKK